MSALPVHTDQTVLISADGYDQRCRELETFRTDARRQLSERLREHRESAYLARQLTRITCDLELGVGVEGLRRRRPDVSALGGLYDHLGFGPFLRRQGDRLAQLPLA